MTRYIRGLLYLLAESRRRGDRLAELVILGKLEAIR